METAGGGSVGLTSFGLNDVLSSSASGLRQCPNRESQNGRIAGSALHRSNRIDAANPGCDAGPQHIGIPMSTDWRRERPGQC